MKTDVTTPRTELDPNRTADVSLKAPVVIRRFLDHCRVAKRLSPNTLRAYKGDLADFVAHVGSATGVAEIDRDVVRHYAGTLLEDRRLKETTVRRRMATLKVLFRWLEREELVPLNVFHRLDLSIRLPKRLPRALEKENMRLLLQVTESETHRSCSEELYTALLMHFVVVTLFTTGLRIGELIDVRLADVYLPDGVIQVRGKGNRERRVYLPGRQALVVVKRFLAARERITTALDYLLVTPNGAAVTANQIRKRLRMLGDQAGIANRITPHMLRHTAATQLLEAGVDIRFVQRLLGHASIATTQIYTQVWDGTLRERLIQANILSRISRRR